MAGEREESSPLREPPAQQAFVGAGSNLGDRSAILREAVARLSQTAGVYKLEVSSIYETEPVGVTDQPPFLNLVVGLDTSLSPDALLVTLLQIERDFGRERTIRWGPRTLDLDLLAYEGQVRSTPTLILPHPRLFERDFVKVPLREILARSRYRGPQWNRLRDQLGPSTVSPGVRRIET